MRMRSTRPIPKETIYPEITLEDNTLTVTRPKIGPFHHRLGILGQRSKLFYQVVASLVILGLVLMVSQSGSKAGQTITSGVKYVLTKNMNLQPYTKKITQFAAQVGKIDLSDSTAYKEEKAAPVTTEDKKQMKMALPVSGKIVQSYGWTKGDDKDLSRFNEGLDISAKLGSPVKAPLAGKVSKVGQDTEFGDYLLVDHGNGLLTFYGYCSEILVKSGQEIKEGATLAKVGTSGQAEEPLLHFEVREKGAAKNPVDYLEME